MSGGGGSIEDFGASQKLANIIAQQYANYQAVYQPIENQQIAWATDPNTINNAQIQAGAQADASSNSALTGLNKTLETSLSTLTPDQKAALQSKFGLQAALSKVGAMNRAGQQTYDTITQVLTGSAPSTSSMTSPAVSVNSTQPT